MITFRFITWHFMRSKTAFAAIFLDMYSYLQAIRVVQIYYFHAETSRTGTVVLKSGQK